MILHIPHASRRIPAAFRDQFVLTDDELQQEQLRLTDAYTDELFQDLESTTIHFPYSRLMVDVERFPDDTQEPMSRIGMGRFYMKTTEGRPLRRALTQDEIGLLDGYYTEHHNKLTDAVESELPHMGRCLLIDCHSFPSTPLPCDQNQSQPRPDFCIGTDDFHTPQNLIQAAFQCLKKEGYNVVINHPYSGTLVPLKFYRKEPHVSSIMIEVNRKLYMDELTGERIENFRPVKTVVKDLLINMKQFYDSIRLTK